AACSRARCRRCWCRASARRCGRPRCRVSMSATCCSSRAKPRATARPTTSHASTSTSATTWWTPCLSAATGPSMVCRCRSTAAACAARVCACSAPAWPVNGSTTPTSWAVRWCGCRAGTAMSFSEDVRHELVERPPAKSCCRLAFLSGLIRHAGSLQVRSGGELAAVAELADPAAARLAFTLLRERGADCEILSFREHRFQRRNRVLLRIAGGTSIQLLHEAGVLSEALTPLERPPRRLLNRACCRGAYLRGALVAAGSVSAPRQPAYLESRDAIRDLLALVGAHDAVLSLQEAEVISATREAANRLTNCDRANLGRTSAAAHRQREAIALLDLELLDLPLRRVAELRMANPSSSLAELGERAHPPMTKSAVARHMKTLISLTKT